jgi:diguanylate cyclase (GGDEF)-like protein
MLPFKKLLSWAANPPELADDNNRKNQLIHTITFELMVMGVVLICLNIYLNLWFMTHLLCVGMIVAAINLILLKKKYNLILCGHIINTLVLALITIGNIWLGETDTSYISWFYVSPIIAAVTIGLNGLIIYSLLSASIISILLTGNFPPVYIIPAEYMILLNNINYLFIFSLMFTTLYNLLVENKLYEALLQEQNFLLHADKKKFHYLSHHDSLTNLPNRSYFHTHLQSLIDLIDPEKNTLTLYFMDLDRFKKINDKYGHEAGDTLLLQASKRLQSCFREKDFIARLGGDEFTALIIHHPTDNIAQVLKDRLEQEFQKPFLINATTIKCTISTGIANYPSDAQNAEALLKIADESMYNNKKHKKMTHKQNS